MNAPHTVSVDVLIETLWGSEAGSNAKGTIQTYVSNLRRTLGDVVVHHAGGYRLAIDRSDVDALAFGDAVVRARHLLESNPKQASKLLRQALAAWRGAPFVGLTDSELLDGEARRLDQLRLAALEHRIEADLALGLHTELVSELAHLTEHHPLHERFYAQHMMALYRCGRQAEALWTYQKLRRTLGEELGIEPSAQVRALEGRMLEQDPELDFGAARIPGETPVTATFLFTDLEKNIALGELDRAGMDEALAHHDTALTDAVARAGGEVFDTTGTGIQATMPGVSEAVAAAESIQRAMTNRNWPTSEPLRVRIGIDTGPAQRHGPMFLGPTLARCARLVSAASGGQTVVSEQAADEAPDSVHLRDLGERRFSGQDRPVRVYQLDVDGLPAEFPPLATWHRYSSSMSSLFAHSVHGYELREEIGEGDFGIIYRAFQPSMGREVAIKFIRPEVAANPSFTRRFSAEARFVAGLEHPHIVTMHDFWRDADGAYLVMRYLRGGSLQQALRRGPWKAGQALRSLSQVGGALGHAHRHGVVHRALEPANVLLDEDGNAYLTDFGIAVRHSDRSGRVGTTAPCYVSPETARGERHLPQSDIYSLGVITCELLTGVRPDGPEDRSALDRARSQLLPTTAEVLATATARDAAARYPTVKRFVDDLQRAFGAPISA